MTWLPFDDRTFSTELSAPEVTRRMSENTQPTRKFLEHATTFPQHGTRRRFEGRVSGEAFELARAVDYRNAFSPVISGKVTATTQGSIVRMKFRLSPLMLITITMWFGFLFTGTTLIGKALLQGRSTDPLMLMPVILFLLSYGLVAFGFNSECKKSVEFFEELLECGSP